MIRLTVISLLVLFFTNSSSGSYAQTADDVVQGYERFTGGSKNWRKIKTLKTYGNYDYGGMIFPFHTIAKAPNKYKVVVSLNDKFFVQGYNGKIGWKIDAFNNETTPTLLSQSDARALVNEGRVELEDPLINRHRKGHEVTLEGESDCGDTRCFKLRVKLNYGTVQTWFISEEDYHLVKIQAISQNPEMGGSLMDIYYDDYRQVDGIRMPFHVSCEIEGQTILTIVVDKMVTNEKVPDGTFEPVAADQ